MTLSKAGDAATIRRFHRWGVPLIAALQTGCLAFAIESGLLALLYLFTDLPEVAYGAEVPLSKWFCLLLLVHDLPRIIGQCLVFAAALYPVCLAYGERWAIGQPVALMQLPAVTAVACCRWEGFLDEPWLFIVAIPLVASAAVLALLPLAIMVSRVGGRD